jgi:hypothetical protein
MSRNAAPSHASHDELLLARYFGDDLDAGERRRAGELIGSCPDCAEFIAELRAIATATSALPAPRRPRDFTLTEAQAARLRRPRRSAGLFGWLGRPRAIGTSMAAIGLAGFLALASLGSVGSTAPTSADAPANPEFGGVAALPTAAPAAATHGYESSVTDQAASAAPTPAASLSAETAAPLTLGPSAVGTNALRTIAPEASGARVPPGSSGPVAAVVSPAASGDVRTGNGGEPVTGKSGGAGASPSPAAPYEPDGSAVTGGPDVHAIAMACFAVLVLIGLLVLLAPPILARASVRRRR